MITTKDRQIELRSFVTRDAGTYVHFEVNDDLTMYLNNSTATDLHTAGGGVLRIEVDHDNTEAVVVKVNPRGGGAFMSLDAVQKAIAALLAIRGVLEEGER